MRTGLHWLLGAALLGLTAPAAAGQLALPDAAARQRTQSLMTQIDAQLRASTSATLTLERWCADHHMATPAQVTVERDRNASHRASAAQRALLDVTPGTPLGYRKVRLVCGTHVLSEAENWYVPSRLTAAMNHALDESDTPYGKVIRPLDPHRKTLADRPGWSPLAAPLRATAPCDATLFSHEALVLDGSGKPLALVAEHYKLELVCGISGG